MTIRNKGICKLLPALLLAAATTTAGAQTNGSNSPYSRYGFGLLSDRAGGFNKGMSGLSYGMRYGNELNTKNPASYSSIDSLSFLFDMGLSLQNANLDQSGKKVNAKNTSFDYLTMGFRASKRLGISLGLLPYSTIGYKLTSEDKILDNPTGNITQTSQFQGDGGVHEVYAGIGWEPFRKFSVGMNAGYLWGDMSHSILASFSDATVNSRRRAYSTDLRTYQLDFGLQYELPINKNNALTLGLVYSLGHDIDSKTYYYDQRISYVSSSSSSVVGDSLSSTGWQLPHSFGAGLVWRHKNSLRVGVDYSLTKWGDVTSPQLIDADDKVNGFRAAKGYYSDMHKVTVGVEYMKDPEGLRWRDRVRYRAGFSYTSPYTKVNGQDGPSDYLVSLGVALPIINYHNNRSFLNISAQYERVEPKVAGMIKENYLRLCVGLSFNERWFMKWKVK